MAFPAPTPPYPAVLMIALRDVSQQTQASALPLVKAGHAFWANPHQVNSLIQGGWAELAPPETVPPPPEPRWTANWLPGFGVGTSNCSH